MFQQKKKIQVRESPLRIRFHKSKVLSLPKANPKKQSPPPKQHPPSGMEGQFFYQGISLEEYIRKNKIPEETYFEEGEPLIDEQRQICITKSRERITSQTQRRQEVALFDLRLPVLASKREVIKHTIRANSRLNGL